MMHLPLIAKMLKFSSSYSGHAIPYGEILFYIIMIIYTKELFLYKAFWVLLHPCKYFFAQSLIAAF